MKVIAICPMGFEDVTQLEIKELLNVESQVVDSGRVLFESEDVEKFIAKSQSAIKVYELKQDCKDTSEVEAFELVSPFRVKCYKKPGVTIEKSSNDIERAVGEVFFNKGNTVDLKNPITVVFLDMQEDKIFVGVDLTKDLLSKREYRIKIHNQSINACIAYGLVRLSGFNDNKVLLDPFAKDGAIAIEAALFCEGKVYTVDGLFHNVKSVEVNSKLAGVRKKVHVSRIDVEWLDTKFQKEEVNCLVTALPYPSKTVKEKDVEKIYKELFYHLDFILAKGAQVVVLAPKLALFKKLNEKLKIVSEREVSTSNLKYKVLFLEKE
jgi:23S rRNA G2445 N2-methylase RlmL